MKSSAILSALVGLLITAGAGSALADTCTPTAVSYDQTSSSASSARILFNCAETAGTLWQILNTPPAACSSLAKSLETMRVQFSMLQAALLSGKSLAIDAYNTTCVANARMVSGNMTLVR